MTSAADIEFARKLFAGPCDFVAGAADIATIPKSRLPEIAFAGRSNVGKSSLLNALTGRGNLARVSNTPGRTRQINFFDLGGKLMLADLPGYGFARVARSESDRWRELISAYLSGRPNLRRVALLIDARRGPMETDLEAMTFLDRAATSYQLVLTKADALKPAALAAAREGALAAAGNHPALHPEVLITSSKAGSGIAELRQALAAFTRS
jgi:GTP-binding protein